MFRSGHDCSSTYFARRPCYFRLQAYFKIWILRKLRKYIVHTRIRFHLCSRLHWSFMRRTGSVCAPLHQVFPTLFESTFNQILPQFLWPIRYFMRNISLYFFGFLFLFWFSNSVESCNGFPRSFSFIPPFLTDTGASTSPFSDTESLWVDVDTCDEDGDEADEDVVEKELGEIPGATNGTKFDKLQSILVSFLMRCDFWSPFQWYVYPCPSQSFPNKSTAGVSSRSTTVTNRSNSLTYTVASSLVCTSPLAVITVVGFLDVLMVSNSAE